MDQAPASPGGSSLPLPASRFFEDLGETVAGPLLCGLLRWIAGQIREDPPEALLFFSRDGKILHRLWQELPQEEIPSVPTRYVLASRRCLRLAAMEELGESTLDFLTSHTRNLTVEELFQRPGLTPSDYLEVLGQIEGIQPGGPCSSVSRKALKAAFRSLETPIRIRAEGERQAYRSYLESTGITAFRRLGVVDIGWHGSLQDSFFRLLKPLQPALVIDGYYAGLFADASRYRTEANRMQGLLLQDGLPEERFREIQSFVELLEFFFSTGDPGLLYLKETDDGRQDPVYGREGRDRYQLEAIAALHRGILRSARNKPESPESVYEKVRRLGLFPNRAEARYLGRLKASRGFGNPETLQPFACRGSLLANMLFWPRFVERFKNALWRPGFWAQLRFPERLLLRLLSPAGARRLSLEGREGEPI